MQGKRVLVADDNNFIRILVKAALANSDYEIIEAVDGFDAYAKIIDEHPDLVLLDLVMPEMSGFEVLERLKEESRASCPVMMLTTAAAAADIARAKEIGATDYLVKPFDKNELREKVATLLAE